MSGQSKHEAEPVRSVGIVGAGRVGQALARLAVSAGFSVLLAGSGDPVRVSRTAALFAPGAIPVWAADAAQADLVVLCIPLGAYDELDPEIFASRTVVDAMNYWPEADGVRDDLETGEPTSVIVQRVLAQSTVVKALNHVSFRELVARSSRPGSPHRVALAIATDDDNALRTVASVIDALGFDAVPIGALAGSAVMEPTGPIFGAVLNAAALRQRLAEG